jgi:hypothetical protein
MSSFYDDASLVVIPSGYKTSKIYAEKPTDGSGDLTFTRASDATRVASNGLIEKVRTNLLTYSNTFSNAAWLNDDSTETSGQTGYDGTTNAWLLSRTGANGRIGQVLSVSGSATFSIYVKAGTKSWVKLASSDAGVQAFFNLSTGAIGTAGAGTIAKITSAGNGYYRCSISGNASFSFLNVWIADADNDTTGATGTILIQGSQVETGDIATAYIPTTTAAVSVGPVSNVPRLDYLGSSCPRLLLEPQRTNLVQYSEQFNNAYWTLSNTTITANTTVSPDGTQNADTAVITAGGYIYAEFINYAAVTGQSATISVFAKSASVELVFFGGATTAGTDVYKIENYGNGWYRHSRVRTFTATATTTLQYLIFSNGTHIIWGAQVEGSNSAYATSYIPTLGAAVTRVADAASKTGISSLIGQTEGTLFVEIDLKNAPINDSYVFLRNAGVTNYLGLRIQAANLRFESVDSGVLQTAINYTINTAQTVKVAMAYKLNDFVMYVNGTQVGTDTSATVPTCDILDLNFNAPTANAFGIAQSLLFKTRLTNSQLAELTSL